MIIEPNRTDEVEEVVEYIPRITPIVIDLSIWNSDAGPQVVMRVVDVHGFTVDVVMEKQRAALFGASLAEFAAG